MAWTSPCGRGQGLGGRRGVAKAVEAWQKPWGRFQGRGGVAKTVGRGKGLGGVAKAVWAWPRP